MFLPSHLAAFVPACVTGASASPWVPSATPGKSSRILRFLPGDAGFVELLRMEPGTAMPLHRHTGLIHAFNLSGTRVLCTGERIGPGDYVFEPPGNVDWWRVEGDEVMTALVVVMGTVEFLDAEGAVRAVASVASQREELRRHVQQRGLAMPAL